MKRLSILLLFPVLLWACSNETSEAEHKSEPEITTPAPETVEDGPDYSPVELPSIHDFLLMDFVPGELTDYEEKPMEGNDFRHVIPGAKEVFIGKYKKKSPISNAYGSGIRPRITVQTFEFEEGADVEKGMVQWIQSMEGGTEVKKLGEPVRALKSPPFLVMVQGRAVSVVSTACEHTGEEWDRLKAQFFSWLTQFPDSGADWAFEVECGGPLSYKNTGK